jgi:hypothetical protein
MATPQRTFTFTRSIGFILLSIILIIVGVTGLIGHEDVLGIILSVMRIVAGILILIGV